MYLQKVKPTGRAYVFIGAYLLEMIAYASIKPPAHLSLIQPLFWTYRNMLGQNPKDRYKLNCQIILHYAGAEAPPLDCPLSSEQWSVQDVRAPDGRQGDRYHKWQKPLNLCERFIRHSTRPGDLVIDPFVGTGTTVLAAGRLGRIGVGGDSSLKNLRIAEQRGCALNTSTGE